MNAEKAITYGIKSYVALLVAVLVLPLVIVIAVSFTPGMFMRFPPDGLSLEWYVAFFTSFEWLVALENSLTIAAGATVVGLSVGGTLAYALDRYEYPFSSSLSTVGLFPILLPPVIFGVALLTLFLIVGISGSIWSVMVAHGLFFSPFPFILITQGLRELDRSHEEAAVILGAAPLTVVRTITYPLIRTNIVSAGVFVFILSLNEYIIAWLLSNLVFTTIPIQIFSSLRYSYSPIIAAVSTIFILSTVVFMIAIRWFTGGIWK